MRTLLEIFQTEPDDAEISTNKREWVSSGVAKITMFTWKDLNDPIWTVKRKPREFWVARRSDGTFSAHLLPYCGDMSGYAESVKVVEVLDE